VRLVFEKSFTKKKILRESSTEDALVHQHGERHVIHKALKTKELGLNISFGCFF
jgi:hypothetical protein